MTRDHKGKDSIMGAEVHRATQEWTYISVKSV